MPLTKDQQEVWDRLKNGIPVPVDDFMPMTFNADGTMMFIKPSCTDGQVTMFKLSKPYDLTSAVVWL